MQVIVPYSVASDMMTLQDVRGQLAETGYPVTLDDIAGWIEADGLYTEHYRRKVYVSYSDILMAHGDRVARKPAAT
ncbi:hypothetical protein ACFVS9_27985 [Streptomyces sp. NPDC058008]|uniref:hypothetical protein n=1 Tax=Streptomyces sp. NPDC058008 TaxID=3346303 RepID=UPI0036E8D30A